jgi:hypothetical protein
VAELSIHGPKLGRVKVDGWANDLEEGGFAAVAEKSEVEEIGSAGSGAVGGADSPISG